LTTFWLLGGDEDEKSEKLLDVTDTITSNHVGSNNLPAVSDP